jgi:hypothetical protein
MQNSPKKRIPPAAFLYSPCVSVPTRRCFVEAGCGHVVVCQVMLQREHQRRHSCFQRKRAPRGTWKMRKQKTENGKRKTENGEANANANANPKPVCFPRAPPSPGLCQSVQLSTEYGVRSTYPQIRVPTPERGGWAGICTQGTYGVPKVSIGKVRYLRWSKVRSKGLINPTRE